MSFKKITLLIVGTVSLNWLEAKPSMQQFFTSNYEEIFAVVKGQKPFSRIRLKLEEFVRGNGDINELIRHPQHEDGDNLTLLMYAAFNGSIDLAQWLLASGAQPNIQTNCGRTSFYYVMLSMASMFYMPCVDIEEVVCRQVHIVRLMLDAMAPSDRAIILQQWKDACDDAQSNDMFNFDFLYDNKIKYMNLVKAFGKVLNVRLEAFNKQDFVKACKTVMGGELFYKFDDLLEKDDDLHDLFSDFYEGQADLNESKDQDPANNQDAMLLGVFVNGINAFMPLIYMNCQNDFETISTHFMQILNEKEKEEFAQTKQAMIEHIKNNGIVDPVTCL